MAERIIARELLDGRERVRGGRLRRGEAAAGLRLAGLLLDPGGDGLTAQPPFQEVDVRARAPSTESRSEQVAPLALSQA
jgi:hypothetical protein